MREGRRRRHVRRRGSVHARRSLRERPLRRHPARRATTASPCTTDFCDAGACRTRPTARAARRPASAPTSECAPGDRGCRRPRLRGTQPASFEQAECTEDDNPCTVDRCQRAAGARTTRSATPRAACRSSRRIAAPIVLRTGVSSASSTSWSTRATPAGDTADRDRRAARQASRRASTTPCASLAGTRRGSDSLPASALRGLRLAATATTAQLRGRIALGLAAPNARPRPAVPRGWCPAGGAQAPELEPESAGELRRNGRILLTETKALKRDVKNLQRTFSVFQR